MTRWKVALAVSDNDKVCPWIENESEPYNSCGYKGYRTIACIMGSTLENKQDIAAQIVRDHNRSEAWEAIRLALIDADTTLADADFRIDGFARKQIQAALALYEQADSK